MSKPSSPLDQEFVADILDPDDDCPFRVVAVVYPSKSDSKEDK